MKIRKGFISNSSSSSFIIGIVNIKQVNTPGSFIFNPDEYEETPYGIYVKKISEDEYLLSIESFTGAEVSCVAKPGNHILYLDETGFNDVWNEEYGEYEYDRVDLSYFGKDDVKKYEKIVNLGGEVYYGAGRDG